MTLYPSLTDRLKSQHKAIPHIIEGIPDQRLKRRAASEKWSIYDNIAHLARYQHVFIARINRILTDKEPVFERYKAEEDEEFDVWLMLSAENLLIHMDGDRKRINDQILALPEARQKRVGIHGKYGKLTIPQWTEFFLLHEAHHIYTIFQLVNDPQK